MKIGILAAGYNCAEYFDQVIEPWARYKEMRRQHQIVLSAVHAQFTHNDTDVRDNSRSLILKAYDKKIFDYVVFPSGSFEEADARNLALQPLLHQGVDFVMLLDLQDEIYTIEEIKRIFTFIEDNPFTVWFSIYFKNYVGDKKHYIDNFCPPRIFRTKMEHVSLSKFYYDNDVLYEGAQIYNYKQWATMIIPKNLAFVKHYTWCGSPERLTAKIAYQLKHFDGICSYTWDNNRNQVTLNPEFYYKFKIPMPIIYEDA